MERNRMYHMTEEDRNDSATALFAPRRDGQVARKVVRQSGSLEIIENGDGEFQKDRSSSEASFRSWSRASVGSVPPRSDSSLSRRTLTPTKQIALQAVKRKEESTDPFIDNIDIDLDSVTFDPTGRRNKKWPTNEDTGLISEESFVSGDFNDSDMAVGGIGSDVTVSIRWAFDRQSMGDIRSQNVDFKSKADTKEDKNEATPDIAKPDKSKEKKKDDSSSDDEDDDSEEEVKLRAPNELLMEFVDCLMKKDFPNADKLCKMILLYEPENPEALKFQPLIEEKMQLDAEAAAAKEAGGSDDDDEEDDDDDDDDDSDEDSDDDDDDDSDDSSSNDDSDEDDKDGENMPSTSYHIPSTSSDVSAPIKGANSVRVWKPAS